MEQVTKRIAIVLLCLVYANMLTGYAVKPGMALHYVDFGVCPIQSQKILEYIKKNLPGENIFTTQYNGSYLLFNLYPHNKIYIDTFWGPHAGDTIQDYNDLLLRKKTGNHLADKYGFKYAVIEGTAQFVEAFKVGWQLTYQDGGTFLIRRI